VEAAEEGGEEAEGEEGVHRGHHEKTEPIEDGGKILIINRLLQSHKAGDKLLFVF
jgi:hypothetical protein